jgi:hypothetical protein
MWRVLVLALTCGLCVAGDQPCKATISAPHLTNKQMEWATNTGMRKYSLCPRATGTKPDYVITFSAEGRSLSFVAPAATAQTTGDVHLNTTVSERQEWPYDIVYTYVFAGEADNLPVKGKPWTPTGMPLYVKSRSGAWHSNADRLALEDAMKFIASNEKSIVPLSASAPRGPTAPVPNVSTSVATSVPAASALAPTTKPAEEVTSMGTVSVTSDPADAEIFVDSKGMAKTPQILHLRAGRYSIQLVMKGYKDWTSDLVVKEDSIVNVTAKLQPRLP